MREPTQEQNALSKRVIAAAIQVHKNLGPGFLESIYESALAVELDHMRIPYEQQHLISLRYRNVLVGDHRLDMLIGEHAHRIVVELKAVQKILPIHHAQIISYLKATNCVLGLLINFNVGLLKDGIERVVYGAANL